MINYLARSPKEGNYYKLGHDGQEAKQDENTCEILKTKSYFCQSYPFVRSVENANGLIR
ncbi:hypothetical protein [Candidatus Endomicrobiellum pyrsonymphae]|uniref:hypothetical protein n=1 Tax=Candidatus Endomicrobiellum pyrsonymphae TaxID=1408203 RepID=UPI0035A996D1